MPVFLNGVKYIKGMMNGRPTIGMFNGKRIWPVGVTVVEVKVEMIPAAGGTVNSCVVVYNDGIDDADKEKVFEFTPVTALSLGHELKPEPTLVASFILPIIIDDELIERREIKVYQEPNVVINSRFADIEGTDKTWYETIWQNLTIGTWSCQDIPAKGLLPSGAAVAASMAYSVDRVLNKWYKGKDYFVQRTYSSTEVWPLNASELKPEEIFHHDPAIIETETTAGITSTPHAKITYSLSNQLTERNVNNSSYYIWCDSLLDTVVSRTKVGDFTVSIVFASSSTETEIVTGTSASDTISIYQQLNKVESDNTEPVDHWASITVGQELSPTKGAQVSYSASAGHTNVRTRVYTSEYEIVSRTAVSDIPYITVNDTNNFSISNDYGNGLLTNKTALDRKNWNYDYNGRNANYKVELTMSSDTIGSWAGAEVTYTYTAEHDYISYTHADANSRTATLKCYNSSYTSATDTASVTSNIGEYLVQNTTVHYDNDTAEISINDTANFSLNTSTKTIKRLVGMSGTLYNSDYNSSNYDAFVSVTPLSYLTAAGGYVSVRVPAANVGHWHKYQHYYKGGSQSLTITAKLVEARNVQAASGKEITSQIHDYILPSDTEFYSEKIIGDSIEVKITQNGNSRFSVNGDKIEHDNMLRNAVTDTLKFKVLNKTLAAETSEYTYSVTNNREYTHTIDYNWLKFMRIINGELTEVNNIDYQAGDVYVKTNIIENERAIYDSGIDDKIKDNYEIVPVLSQMTFTRSVTSWLIDKQQFVDTKNGVSVRGFLFQVTKNESRSVSRSATVTGLFSDTLANPRSRTTATLTQGINTEPIYADTYLYARAVGIRSNPDGSVVYNLRLQRTNKPISGSSVTVNYTVNYTIQGVAKTKTGSVTVASSVAEDAYLADILDGGINMIVQSYSES